MTDQIKTLNGLCEFLNGIRHNVNAKPIKVTIGKSNWFGALYSRNETYIPTERAVTENRVLAGELWQSHVLYLLGTRPKQRRKTVYVWQHALPFDLRAARSVGEWYVGGWNVSKGKEYQQFRPFGDYLLLHDYPVHTYGYYKDHLIDTLEPITYTRQPMQVEFVT